MHHEKLEENHIKIVSIGATDLMVRSREDTKRYNGTHKEKHKWVVPWCSKVASDQKDNNIYH